MITKEISFCKNAIFDQFSSNTMTSQKGFCQKGLKSKNWSRDLL